jgi:hypothetical protein
MGKKKPLTIHDFSRMGVKARQEKVSPERRKEIASIAAKARWNKKQPKGKGEK